MTDKKVFLYATLQWVDVDYETDEYYVAHGSDGIVTYVYKDGQEQVMGGTPDDNQEN